MPILVKKDGAYVAPEGVFAKSGGEYSAASTVMAKVAGSYVEVGGAPRRLSIIAGHHQVPTGTNSAQEIGSINTFRLYSAVEADEPIAFELPYFVGAEEALGDGTATVGVSLEYPLGTDLGTWLFNGATSGTIAAGKTIRSDLRAPGAPLPDGGKIRTRTFMQGMDGIVFFQVIQDGENEMRFGPLGSVTSPVGGTGPMTGGGSDYGGLGYHPSLILGMTDRNVYAIPSDSKGRAYNDQPDSPYGATGNVQRSIPVTTPTMNLGVDSSSLQNVVGNMDVGGNYEIRGGWIREFATHVIMQLGVNDIYNGGRSAEDIQDDIALFKANVGGLPIIQTTIGPVTTSINDYVDAEGQTVEDDEPVRLEHNNFVRSLGPQEKIDVARFIDPTDSGKWPTDGTPYKFNSDRLHESRDGYLLEQTNGTPQCTWVV